WTRIALERNVRAEAELARLDLHDALRELRRVSVELHGVEQPRDRVELRRPAVQRRAEYLKRAHDLGGLAVHLYRVDGRVARKRRMVAVMARQIAEQRLHALAVMVEPRHVLADLRAVGGDLVAKVRLAEREKALGIAVVQREAGPVDELLDLLALVHRLRRQR